MLQVRLITNYKEKGRKGGEEREGEEGRREGKGGRERERRREGEGERKGIKFVKQREKKKK